MKKLLLVGVIGVSVLSMSGTGIAASRCQGLGDYTFVYCPLGNPLSIKPYKCQLGNSQNYFNFYDENGIYAWAYGCPGPHGKLNWWSADSQSGITISEADSTRRQTTLQRTPPDTVGNKRTNTQDITPG